jgi:hypothetical protein
VNDTVATDEIARYAAAVRAAFADLPGGDREGLLEDLEDHLREVLSETGGPLEERLGPPDAYADELRSSAGLPPRSAAPPGSPGLRLAWHVLQRSGRAVRDLLVELRPAWWVARGYLLVLLVNALFARLLPSSGPVRFPLPAVFGSQALGLLTVAAAVAASVALGRRRATSAVGRRLRRVGNLAVAAFAIALLLDLGRNYTPSSSLLVPEVRPQTVAPGSTVLPGTTTQPRVSSLPPTTQARTSSTVVVSTTTLGSTATTLAPATSEAHGTTTPTSTR